MSLASIPHAFAPARKLPAGATLLFLHGLGDQGHSWSHVLSAHLQPSQRSLQVVAPHAPVGTLAISGQEMPLWFTIKEEGTRERPERQDREGMERSRELIERIVKDEVEQGRKVILGGFSQGAVMTLFAGLQSKYPLAGLVVLSGFVPQATTLPSLKSPTLPTNLPIFLAHGTADRVIAPSYGHAIRAFLSSDEVGLGGGLEWHEYQGLAHSSGEDEMRDLARWVDRVLAEE